MLPLPENFQCTEQEFTTLKPSNLISIKCLQCAEIFKRRKCTIISDSRRGRSYPKFCSVACFSKHTALMNLNTCKHCGAKFIKNNHSQIFCSSSCSATYNNTHKTKGTRVSKLELWLSTILPNIYPNLEFHFNKKNAINSELDIYIPSLKLAFELNGIFHYEPIYGADKLNSIQNNDGRKFQACIEKGISLCIIDTSNQKSVTEKTSQKFLEIIKNIIDGCI